VRGEVAKKEKRGGKTFIYRKRKKLPTPGKNLTENRENSKNLRESQKPMVGLN